MPSKLKRVSEITENRIAELAERDNRTFVAQLDVVVNAGLAALGEPIDLEDTPTAALTPQPEPQPATAGS